MLSATDNIGRVVRYGYDDSHRLTTVRDPDGGTTTYGWDTAANVVTSIQDARGVTFLTNTYDANNRVTKQVLANGGAYRFAYTPNAAGAPGETDTTDPAGAVRKTSFNAAGYIVSDQRAAGAAVEQDWSYARDPASNLVTSRVCRISTGCSQPKDSDDDADKGGIAEGRIHEDP